ncbi:CIC11C00000003426 [Sungouiella intermedia]|uniref:CIC11C00000002606 n=2 Tax=Sungouiella intermedia TaxID=45354 RepID=A0A1L0D5Q3_9ASCO|nr:CIC11C00000002606 [[Candida] intermedia]SGZ51828.1 CIC11C00000003426 [[Candida] intermedia]
MEKRPRHEFVCTLARKFDIFLIQEFVGSTDNYTTYQQFSTSHNYQFYSSPSLSRTRANHLLDPQLMPQTGIFLNLKKCSVISQNEITQKIQPQIYCNDIRIRLPTGEMVLIVNAYLPSQPKTAQVIILQQLLPHLQDLQTAYPDLKVIFGGDMNHSMERTPSLEQRLVSSTLDILAALDLVDIGICNPTVFTLPTNHGTLPRRIDRIYVPTLWQPRAFQYQLWRPRGITSSHSLIAAHLVIDMNPTNTFGLRRFQYPLGRLLPLYETQGQITVNPDGTLDEAIAAITQEGLEYIQLHRTLRRIDPEFARSVRDTSTEHLEDSAEASLRSFFQYKSHSAMVFHDLTNVAQGTRANTNADMLRMVTSYYKALYSEPTPGLTDRALKDYLGQIKVSLSAQQAEQLDRPFTQEELTVALKLCNHGTAPGPDGIQYSVLRYHWKQFCPVLVRTGNELLQTGMMPDAFREVLITLIPKRHHSASTDVTHYRPILLINCCLRVVSQAANTRIQSIADTLIGPNQRGFMSNRRMDENLMETRTLLNLIKEAYPKDDASAPERTILMADFNKAFDRVSHRYIRQVLCHMGFGPRMTSFLMLITSGQIGRITINNYVGRSFPLLSGVRQGNPVSPILFNLAIEPLLCRLQQNLIGIPIEYDPLQITIMKYHAFADDVNIYLGDVRDYATTAAELGLFEKASSSLVNTDKSVLYGTLPGFQQGHDPFLPYPRKHLWTRKADSSLEFTDTTYLGIPLNGVLWDSYLRTLPFLCKTQAYQLLRLCVRAMGTNIYVHSKLPFRDLHTPMPSRPLNRVKFAISKVFYGISLKKLYTPPQKGGYGLIETGLQLQGHRAKVIYHVVTDDQSWFSAYMRLKFMHHMGTLALRNAHTSYQALEKKLGYTYIGCYNWEDFLFSRHRTSHLNLTFTASEVAYLHAWDKHAPKTRAPRLRPHSASATQLMTKVQALAQLSPEERKWCQAKNFASLSRKHHRKDTALRSEQLLRLLPLSYRHWKKFWKELYHLEWQLGHSLEAGQFTAPSATGRSLSTSNFSVVP